MQARIEAPRVSSEAVSQEARREAAAEIMKISDSILALSDRLEVCTSAA